MSVASVCHVHGPLPEGQQFCEHCMLPGQQDGSPGAVSLSACETESLGQFVPGDSTGLPRTALPGFGFAARSIGDLEYNSGPVQPGERWTLRLRLPRLLGRAEVQVRVAGQSRSVSLVNGREHIVQFEALIAGTHHLNFHVRMDTRKFEGDGSVEARVRGVQGDRPPVNVNASGTGNFVNLNVPSSENPVGAWLLCALRDHPHAAVTLQPRKNSERVPSVVFLRPPSGQVCRLIRGNRNIIGRGPQSHIDLVQLGQPPAELSASFSREALELELRSSGCVHLAVRNRLGAHINGQPLGKDQSKDIPLHAFESWQKIEFPGEIVVRLKSISSPSEGGTVHSPWTEFGHIARDHRVGGLHVRVEILGERIDLFWVLDAVSFRDVSPHLPGAGVVFEHGECLYHLDTTGLDPLGRTGPRSAFPLERGAEWELSSGRWGVPYNADGEVHG